jgi:hypothetical protein
MRSRPFARGAPVHAGRPLLRHVSRLSQRADVAGLVLLLVYEVFVNAGMIGPVAEMERSAAATPGPGVTTARDFSTFRAGFAGLPSLLVACAASFGARY